MGGRRVPQVGPGLQARLVRQRALPLGLPCVLARRPGLALIQLMLAMTLFVLAMTLLMLTGPDPALLLPELGPGPLGRGEFGTAATALGRAGRLRTGGARRHGTLVVGDNRRGVNGGAGRPGGTRKVLVAEGAQARGVPIADGPGQMAAIRVLLLRPGGLGPRDQVDERPQMGTRNLGGVIAFLAERPRYGPGSVHRNVQQDYPDAQVLHLGHDLRQVLLGADDDGVADSSVPGQRDQVAVDLGLDALAMSGPHPPEP